MAGKILIVDDDRDIAQIVQLLLEGEGYDTQTAASGSEALEKIDSSVDLVILDIMMAGASVKAAMRPSSFFPPCPETRKRWRL